MGRAKRKWSSGRRAQGAGYGGGRQIETASAGVAEMVNGSTECSMPPESRSGVDSATGSSSDSGSGASPTGASNRVASGSGGGVPDRVPAAEQAANKRQAGHSRPTRIISGGSPRSGRAAEGRGWGPPAPPPGRRSRPRRVGGCLGGGLIGSRCGDGLWRVELQHGLKPIQPTGEHELVVPRRGIVRAPVVESRQALEPESGRQGGEVDVKAGRDGGFPGPPLIEIGRIARVAGVEIPGLGPQRLAMAAILVRRPHKDLPVSLGSEILPHNLYPAGLVGSLCESEGPPGVQPVVIGESGRQRIVQVDEGHVQPAQEN